MKIIGSVIARLGSKRLIYKNLLPYKGTPLVLRAVRKLIDSGLFSQVVLSTDSELIARTCMEEQVTIIRRPSELSGDEIPSIPVFRHIVSQCPCDLHLNYNCNFPECDDEVFKKAIEIARQKGESLSDPFAVWAQTKSRLDAYGDPLKITAFRFKSAQVHPLDVHSLEDLLQVHLDHQDFLPEWK